MGENSYGWLIEYAFLQPVTSTLRKEGIAMTFGDLCQFVIAFTAICSIALQLYTNIKKK